MKVITVYLNGRRFLLAQHYLATRGNVNCVTKSTFDVVSCSQHQNGTGLKATNPITCKLYLCAQSFTLFNSLANI